MTSTERIVPLGHEEWRVFDRIAAELFVAYLLDAGPVPPDKATEATSDCSRRAFGQAEIHLAERRRRYGQGDSKYLGR